MGKRTFSTGYQRSRIHTYMRLLKYFRRNAEFARHDYQDVFLTAREGFEKHLDRPIKSARILEVGCGQRFIVTLLFHSLGAHVTGIDTDVVHPRMTPSVMLKIIRENGFERFVKTIARRWMFDREYYRIIGQEAKVHLQFDGLDIRCMSAYEMDFADAEFDYVYSNAVFEHIDNPEEAVKEVHRVMKPGGVASIVIHLYPSISGGHNLEWHDPDNDPSKTVPPWDHLRQNLHPTHVYLNKWRERDYVELVGKYFTVVDLHSTCEGKQFLSPGIAEELTDYTEDELLKRSIHFILRKEA